MTDDELKELFAGLVRYVIDLNVRLEALQAVVHEHGVSETAYKVKYVELRRASDENVKKVFQQAKNEDVAAHLRRMLEEFEGREH